MLHLSLLLLDLSLWLVKTRRKKKKRNSAKRRKRKYTRYQHPIYIYIYIAMYLNNNRSLGTESEKRKKLDTAERRVSKARRRGRRMMISVRGVDGDAWLTKCPLSRAPCPGSAAIVGGEAGMSLPPRALYGRASAYDGIAVTLDDSIHRDYVLDNVCFVQTWLPTPHPPSPPLIRLI